MLGMLVLVPILCLLRVVMWLEHPCSQIWLHTFRNKILKIFARQFIRRWHLFVFFFFYFYFFYLSLSWTVGIAVNAQSTPLPSDYDHSAMQTHSGVGQHLVVCVCAMLWGSCLWASNVYPSYSTYQEITRAIESTQVLLTGTFETTSS